MIDRVIESDQFSMWQTTSSADLSRTIQTFFFQNPQEFSQWSVIIFVEIFQTTNHRVEASKNLEEKQKQKKYLSRSINQLKTSRILQGQLKQKNHSKSKDSLVREVWSWMIEFFEAKIWVEKDKRKLTTVWGFRLSPTIDKNFSVACSPRATGVSVLSDLRITTKKLLQVWSNFVCCFSSKC